jgi:enolase
MKQLPKNPAIDRIHAREVLDSRGRPTVEVEVFCHGGACGRAMVPCGASTGKHEAVEIRDADATRHAGKGVRRAVQNVIEQLAPHICGLPVTEQASIDRLLTQADGTPDRSGLGANALLGVSLACAHAAAAARGLRLWEYLDSHGQAVLPLPMVNMISGGLHAGRNLDLQDFLLLPIGARTYSEAIEIVVEVYHTLGPLLTRHGFEGVLVGDEGGYGPRLNGSEQAIEFILEAIELAGLTPGRQAALGLDVASSHFFREGLYHLRGGPLDSGGMIELLCRWVNCYPIVSIEDGLAEDDWNGWQLLTKALGRRVQLIGDDLFVTNASRVCHGITQTIANAVLIKPNQVGTLTETLEVTELARQADYRAVISARSGETEDTTLADLAVASGAGQIKIGSMARSERLAKYNQLLRIEEQLGQDHFAVWRPVGVG